MRLTNSSIIGRVWPDQAAFQSDLLASVVAGFDDAGHLGATTELLMPLLRSFDRSTPEARWASALEFGRIATEIAISTRVGRRNWELFIGVWVVAVTNPQGKSDERLQQALTEGMDATTAAWEELLRVVYDYLGIRVRADVTHRQFCESIAAMAAGFALRQASREERQVVPARVGPEGRAAGVDALRARASRASGSGTSSSSRTGSHRTDGGRRGLTARRTADLPESA